MTAMGSADLHIHTNAGDGLDSIDAILAHVEHHTDLDVIAITEHDSLAVAHRARDAWARGSYRFDFVPGVEVTTLEGHLVALYLESPVPSLRRVEETIEAVHRQGGVCIVPHPMSWLTRSIGPGTFARLYDIEGGPRFDAIELHNPSPPARFSLAKARRLNDERYKLPATGASDAHFVDAIGSGRTLFQGSSAAGLRVAFETGALSGESRPYPSLRQVGLARTLSLPLVGLRATPKQLGWRRTAWSFVSRYFPEHHAGQPS
jgi:predicted metal-dependent phosphoesterase TrpH